MKLWSASEMWSCVYRGWYCYRKLVKKDNSFCNYLTLVKNFWDSLLSLSLSSILLVRSPVLTSSLVILSVWLVASSNNLLMSALRCLPLSSSSLSLLSKVIILFYILVTAPLVLFLNMLTSSVCASILLLNSATCSSMISLCVRNSYPLRTISLSSLF